MNTLVDWVRIIADMDYRELPSMLPIFADWLEERSDPRAETMRQTAKTKMLPWTSDELHQWDSVHVITPTVATGANMLFECVAMFCQMNRCANSIHVTRIFFADCPTCPDCHGNRFGIVLGEMKEMR